MQPAADSSEDQQHIPAPREEAEPVPAEQVEQSKLGEREQQILAFEARWWKHAGSKEQAIRDTFGLGSTRYYQLLNALLDDPAALEHDPVLVGRLRRLRSTRARTRRR
ncbi:DUF3263 domain-containing protein [Actinoplanes sp. Pm04-4]|uniref:DUF3263 domain-containing protein n=1 Tax=Paractinoplanes pyxinae TaxID=2997416 RepID=A0ABT4B851_9ACTN|nr:DUF3263 domain-containing protein [Actinoplanes pyxinae]MCY1142683.1 DUF3263 domain-containing protein [Actinoplanes pyxinae]